MGVVMTKSPGMSLLPSGKPAAHVQNLTWENAHEPPFTSLDVQLMPAQELCTQGKLQTGSNGFSGLNSDWKVRLDLLVTGNII